MKYHDSIDKAEKLSAIALQQLQVWHLPASPINFAVSYEYAVGKNIQLIAQIKQQLSLGRKLDSFFFTELYQLYVLNQSSLRDELVSDLDTVLTNSQHHGKQSANYAEGLVSKIDSNLIALRSEDKVRINNAVDQIEKASRSFKQKQKQLAKQLAVTQKQSKALQEELTQVQNEIYLDPLTGLYNRKALNKHLDAWTKDDPNKQISAIVATVDQMPIVTEKFGQLLGDVLLSKIANKVGSYVDGSGLPVRSSHDEFLILLPEVERSIAVEIAEKIRQGVEKLRFVSSKSGVRLPKMTISLGVNDFTLAQNVDAVINYTRTMVTDLQRDSQNQVAVAN